MGWVWGHGSHFQDRHAAYQPSAARSRVGPLPRVPSADLCGDQAAAVRRRATPAYFCTLTRTPAPAVLSHPSLFVRGCHRWLQSFIFLVKLHLISPPKGEEEEKETYSSDHPVVHCLSVPFFPLSSLSPSQRCQAPEGSNSCKVASPFPQRPSALSWPLTPECSVLPKPPEWPGLRC